MSSYNLKPHHGGGSRLPRFPGEFPTSRTSRFTFACAFCHRYHCDFPDFLMCFSFSALHLCALLPQFAPAVIPAFALMILLVLFLSRRHLLLLFVSQRHLLSDYLIPLCSALLLRCKSKGGCLDGGSREGDAWVLLGLHNANNKK